MQPPGTATSAGGTAATAQSPMPPASFISFPIRPMMAPWFPAYPMPSTSTATAAPGSADTSAMEVSGMTQKSSMTPIGFPPTSPDVVWMVPWIVSQFKVSLYICLIINSSRKNSLYHIVSLFWCAGVSVVELLPIYTVGKGSIFDRSTRSSTISRRNHGSYQITAFKDISRCC